MQETLGTVLRRTREGKKISREKLAEISGVPLHPLILFEEDRFVDKVSEAYAFVYLRKIAMCLELQSELLRSLYLEVYTARPGDGSSHRGVGGRDHFLYFSYDTWRTLFVVGVVVGLLGYQAYNYFRLPFLVILYPEDNMVSTEREIEIHGKTQRGILVKINNEAVQGGENEFRHHYFLTPGVNILEIEAERRFGKKLHIRRIVMYNP